MLLFSAIFRLSVRALCITHIPSDVGAKWIRKAERICHQKILSSAVLHDNVIVCIRMSPAMFVPIHAGELGRHGGGESVA